MTNEPIDGTSQPDDARLPAEALPIAEEHEPLNLLETLLAEAAEDTTEETFELVVGRGHTLTARGIRKADDLAKIFRRAKTFVKKTKANTPPPWHPYLPISEDVAQGMALMEVMLVSPKWTHVDMLRLAKQAGGYFLSITTELKGKALGMQVQADIDEMDAEGNG